MRLMTISWLFIRLGVRHPVGDRVSGIPDSLRLRVLSALLTLLGVCAVAGCYLSRTINQATVNDVNNRNFTFTNGKVFHDALANVSTTLAFANNATTFTLCSGSSTATGTNKFGSCTLTVITSSYSAGAGPQIHDVITLDPCDFDSDNSTLMVSRGALTTTSAVPTAGTGTGCGTGGQTIASELNNQRFTFAKGGVFHPALNNVQTALGFSNNAQQFTLTSAGVISGTASGTSSVVGNSCSLTVTTSSYSPGPQKNTTIALNPCTFNTTDNTLTVANLGMTVTSSPGVIQ